MGRKDLPTIFAENPKTYDQFTDQDYFYFATGGADAATTLAELRKKLQSSASESFSATITADKNKNIGSYNLSSGALTLNMAASGNIPGVEVLFKIVADGVSAVNIGTGFDTDALIGIDDGEVLQAGAYLVKLRYEADGAILELPTKQAADILVNNAKISYNASAQAEMAANNAKISYNDSSTVAAHEAAIPLKVDKDNTIPDGEILQKKAGGNFEGAGKKLNDIVIRTKEVPPTQILDFSDVDGVVTTIIFNTPVTESLEIASIENVGIGDTVELHVPHGGFAITFSPTLVNYQSNFVNYDGMYLIKIKRTRKYISAGVYADSYIVTDISGASVGSPLTPLSAPVQSIPTVLSDSSITFNFSDPNSDPNESSIELQYDTLDTFDGNPVIILLPANSTTRNVIGLTAQTTYYSRVRHVGDGVTTSTSAWSNIESAQTQAAAQIQLLAPTQFAPTVDSSSAITFNYNDPNSSPQEVSIEIEYDTVNTFDATPVSVTAGANSTSRQVASLTASTIYFSRVRAVGNGTTTITSAWSGLQSAQTNAATGTPQQVLMMYGPDTSQPSQYKFSFIKVLSEDYDPLSPANLIIHLHGLGEKGTQILVGGSTLTTSLADLELLKNNGPCKAVANGTLTLPANTILVAPQGPSGYWAPGTSEITNLKAFITYVLNEAQFGHEINTDKVGLSGLSMGAQGCMVIMEDAAYRPLFAWCAPFSLTMDIIPNFVNPSTWNDVAFWWFMGSNDPYGILKISEAFYECLQQIDPVETPKLTIYNGASYAHGDTVWADTWIGANHDAPVTNSTWNSTTLNSTQHTAINDFLTWALSKSKSALDILNAPTQSAATVNSETSITANFDDPNTSPAESSIEVQYDTVNTFDNVAQIATAAAGATSKEITGLVPDTTYYFRVRHVGNGSTTQTSAWSNIVSATTQAASPTQLTAPTQAAATVVSQSSLTFNFNDPNTNPQESSVQVQYDVVNTFDSNPQTINGSAGATSATATGLAAGTLYYSRVRAVGDGINTSTSDWSNVVSATTEAASGNPSILINCGNSVGGGNWNNYTNPHQTAALSNMIDSNGDPTTVDIVKISGSGGIYNAGPDTGNDSGVLPDAVMGTYVYALNNDSGLFYRIDGLVNDAQYDISFHAGAVGYSDITQFFRLNASLVDQESVEQAVSNNSTTLVTMRFTANASGQIWFRFRRKPGSTYGFMNALIIEPV